MAIFDLGFNDAAQAAGDFAGAAGDLITAGGYRAERDAYAKSATLADQNAQIEAASTQIKVAQNTRELYQVTGGQRADVAAAGLSESGSAMDIIRDSASQGALQKSLINQQGEINQNAYEQQSVSLVAQAHSADAASDAATASAAGKIAAGAVHTGASIVHLLTLGLF